MIIATQRPTVNIITGTIKANFPGRMAFKVMSSVDSKTILDGTGANQLIGRGDMLILDKGTPVRVQCAFVDTPEVIAINKFIADQQGYNGPLELPEPINTEEGGGGGAEDIGNLDPLFGEAARVIINTQQGSTSLIQRKFSIGYNRAGRLMDQLEKAGVVGAAHGSKPRDVLIQDEETLQSLINTLGAN
jgi:S-DNA-T family DNA segregation ATPase FtsK/SpoIIIE